MSIIIKNIKKKFGNYVAVDDVSLQVNEGEFVALLGPSGSGKTTLLRIIAGLESADEGDIFLEGTDATGKPTVERKIGFVFQHFALFKHMTVFDNIAFGLRLKRPKLSEIEIETRIDKLLHFVHLEGVHTKYPSMLSGGQRQRVALARVLAIEPKYMLLDEPFGALDAKVRKELRRWLKKLHDTSGLTTIFVTHDQEEAMEMADKIAILNEGQLVEVGTPLQLWKDPKTPFVFDFLGNYNTFFGYEIGENQLIINKGLVEEKGSALIPPSARLIKVFSRPHETVINRTPDEMKFYLQAVITMINQAGALVKLELEDRSGFCYQVDLDQTNYEALDPHEGETLWIKPQSYRSFS
jgi:sulfate transport system ATP-binding protein